MPYKVYAKVENERIVDINSDAFLQNLDGWAQIDSGEGDRYQHAQWNYFEKRVKNADETHNYRYENGQVRKATEAEIAAELAEIEANRPPVPPTPIEELQAENRLQKAQLMAQGDRQDFIEDCIAEMAMHLYA